MARKSTQDLEHMLPARRHIAQQSDKLRFDCIWRDCWVNHPSVDSIRSAVRAVYAMPPISRAQCIVVSGVTGMGKTSLFEKIESDLSSLRKRHPESRGYVSFPLAPDPTLKSFEQAMGEALGVPIGSIQNGLIPRSFSRLMHLRTMRIIMIDEIHDLLNANKIEQRKFLSFCRAMTGPPLSLSIVAFGTQEAKHALVSDEQLNSRFESYDLKPWQENEDFRSFLAAYESYLPLKKPSELWQQEKVKFLLGATAGVTDGIVKRIKRAAVWSIMSGKESIDLESLQKAAHIPPFYDWKADEK